ncbi:S-methyl-5-thioribose-1-phosphate isomerase [Adhaeretor mobilis]|uniref:Methylthioribose-1-phosphate isomerase n=1 Tax=Adhaeretor mobilis TaxID=1930276 RepID=A0A517MRR5_9BACT|nr:S-methyl-5-thioribose-1-phosphate isomerase [Adhaeretor mobilis]QDS97477.1 Methylthioribose-1-phosphate isomerase [Adhaeretor mobilis]
MNRDCPPTLQWIGETDGHLRLIDQTRLPTELVEIDCHTVEDVWQAIKRLSVRGAPAIGVAAAYGVCLATQAGGTIAEVRKACDYLATSRPTAVNLFWALDRMRSVVEQDPSGEALLNEARAIHEEDAAMCAAIGKHGADILVPLFEKATSESIGILTHCNAGALATGGEGTALSVIFELARRDLPVHVWVDETRPLLQGSRLTAWELTQRGIPCTLICDNMAATVMKEGRVQAVVTGADRIAANGDAANKIGTYGAATLARAHDIPFYIAAPTSTIDPALATGEEIPIEERDAEEVTNGFGSVTAPEGVSVYNPAFDVTPAELIAGWITEERAMDEFNLS